MAAAGLGSEVDRVNRKTPSIAVVEVEALKDGDLAPETLLWPYVLERRPVVLRGLARNWECCRAWKIGGVAAITKRAGSIPCRAFVSNTGHYHLDGTWNPRTVLTCSMARETTISGFFRGLVISPEEEPCRRKRCRMTDGTHIVDHLESRIPVGQDIVAECSSWPSAYCLDENFHRGRKDKDLDGHCEIHPLARDVPVLPFRCPKGGEESVALIPEKYHNGKISETPPSYSFLRRHKSTQLFLSRGPTHTQLHRDPFDNVYVVASGGDRVWTVCHPDHAPWLTASAEHDEDEDEDDAPISAVCQPGLGIWGACAETTKCIRFSSIALSPGDGLFLPAGWWHSVKALPPYSAAVNWYFAAPDKTTGEAQSTHSSE